MTKPKDLELIRSDMSTWLIHFTQCDPDGCDDEFPFKTLNSIIDDSCLNGSNKYITGSHNCICFTEAPLTKAISLIKYAELQDQEGTSRKIRYAQFGIAVRKEWLYAKGGRPVFYLNEDQSGDLPEEYQHLYVQYNPNKKFDFTWEREWRIKRDKLKLEPENTTIFVKNKKYRDKLLQAHYKSQANKSKVEIYPWGLVSLDEIS